MPLTPDAFAEVLTLPEFSGMRPAERAAVFDAGLKDLDGWMAEQALDDDMRAAFAETRAALGTRYRPAQSDIELDRQSPLGTGWNAFKNFGPEVVGGTVKGLAQLGDAAAETVGLSDPKQKSWLDSVAGFAEGVIDEGKLMRPTNPANPTAATIGSGAGQAVGLLGTAAASVPALGMKAIAAVPVAMGFGMGAGQGVDTAEDMGIESPAGKLAMGTTFGGIEAATEMLGGIGGRFIPVGKGLTGMAKTIGVESVEEVLAGTLQDATTAGVGQFMTDPNRPGYTESGYKLPALDAAFTERRKQEAIGGASGGMVFAGVNTLSQPASANPTSPNLPPRPTIGGRPVLLTPTPEEVAVLNARAAIQAVPEPAPVSMLDIAARAGAVDSLMPEQEVPPASSPTELTSQNAPVLAVPTRNPAFVDMSDEVLTQRHAEAVRLSNEPSRPDRASWGSDAVLMGKELQARQAPASTPDLTGQSSPAAITIPARSEDQQSPLPMIRRDEAGQPPGVELAPATVAAAAEAAAVEVKPAKRWRMPIRAREDGVTDVLDYMAGEGIKIERPARIERDRMGRATNAFGEHDAMKRLRQQLPAYYRAMTTDNGYKPDEAAQILFEAGVIAEPTPDAITDAIESAVGQRRGIRGKARQERIALANEERDVLRQGKRQDASWNKANAPAADKTPVRSDEMQKGMTLEVDGEPMTVLEVDYDEDGNWNGALIEDGDRFGRQWVENGEMVQADEGTVQTPAVANSPDFSDLAAAEQNAAKGMLFDAPASARPQNRGETARPQTADPLAELQGAKAAGEANQAQGRLQFSSATTSNTPAAGTVRATIKAATDALKLLAERMPHLLNGRLRTYADAAAFLADAGYHRGQGFTSAELAALEGAEAFYDRLTGSTVLLLNQIGLREGETPMRAVARVLNHERVGHEGVNALIKDNAEAAKWDKLAGRIPQADLDGIAMEPGYTHLAGDRGQLALEWLARQTDRIEGARNAAAIEGGLTGIAKQLWQALKELLNKFFANFSRSAAFAQEVAEIITRARAAQMAGTALPMTADAMATRLQMSMVRHTPGTPFEVRNLMVRALLTNSPLPTSMRDTLAETKNEKAALDHAAARIGKMIELAVAAVVKRTGMPLAHVSQLVNDVFDGKPAAHATLQTVDDTLAEASRLGRNLLDEMSVNIGLYLPAGTMRTTIMQNLGGWMRRGYAVFDAGANWNYKTLRAAADKGVMHNGQDARKLMQDAVKHIVSQNSKLAGQVGQHGLPRADTALSGILIDLLDRDTTMNALIPGRGNTVRKDVSSLIRRKDIAPAIRALMGEHTSPLKRYAASASFQTQFLAKYQAQARMRQMGLATGLFSTTQTDTYHDAIPEADSWGPLAGLYTTRELLTAMEQASMLNVAGSDMPSLIGKAYKAILANAKMNMVALNPKSTAVNLIGGGVSSVASGDVLAPGIVERFRKAITLAWRDGTPTKADMLNAHTLALRDVEAQERAFFIGSGLLNNNVTLAEIEANTPEALMSLLGDDNAKLANMAVGAAHGMAAGNALGRVAGPVGQGVGIAIGGAAGAVVGGKNVQWAYKKLAEVLMSKPDTMWKVAAFYSQRRTALLAGMTPADAAKRAVERVRNSYPDYSKISPIFRHLSLLPVLGNFVSFSHELVRNLVWNFNYAKEDLASGNAALRADALRRIAGMSAAYLFSTPLLNAAGTLLFGWLDDDDEREEIFRKWLAADYEKDAALTFKSANADGVTYFKQSYLIPQGIFGDMIFTAAKRAKDGEIGDAILKPMAMMLSQFGIGQNIFNTLVEAASGEDKYNRRIYSDHDNAAVKLLKGGDHVAETFTDPGYAKIIEQMVRHANSGNTEELSRMGNGLMGVRDRRVTWDKAVTSAYYKFRSQIQAVKDDAKQKLDPRNQHLLTQSTQIVDGANAALTEIEGEIARFESDMGRLPIPAGVVSKARREVLPRKISRVEFKP